jgi:flagellar basal-body rod protein FlgF
MEPILYKAMNGSEVDFNRQTIHSGNLANVNTPGFKSDLYQAQTAYYNAPDGSTDAFSVQIQNGTDFGDGPLMTTGRNLDMALQGDAWFAVQNKKGEEAYTRAGGFNITETGQLVTNGGYPVLGSGGPIAIPPYEEIEFASDGTISIIPLGASSKELAVLDRVKLVKADAKSLYKNIDGLMAIKAGAAKPVEDSSIKMMSGVLEGSNTNPAGEMVDMIYAAREYEYKMKMMQTVDDNSSKLAQLLQD